MAKHSSATSALPPAQSVRRRPEVSNSDLHLADQAIGLPWRRYFHGLEAHARGRTSSMNLCLHQFPSVDELCDVAGPWDDLWRRSAVLAPTARAQCVAQWVRQFAPESTFRALVVESEGRFVAALPLVAHRVRGILNVGSLPQNEWAASGDLLLDPAADTSVVLDRLVEGCKRLPWNLLRLREVPLEADHWVAFRQASERAGMSVDVKETNQVAQVEIGDDWDRYEATRKGNHRRSRRRYAKILEKAGGVVLEMHTHPTPDEIDALVRRGFEVEDRSWKGAAGTSVLKTPGLLEFYSGEARQVAEWGQLALTFLEHQGRAIAFNYGWQAKGTHFTAKLGYDDEFRKFGPGQQMLMHLLERLHADEACELLDFWGPVTDWHRSWATQTYRVGQIAIAVRGGVRPTVFRAYQRWLPRLRRLRERWAPRVA